MEAIIQIDGGLYVCPSARVPKNAKVLVVGTFSSINIPLLSIDDGIIDSSSVSGVLYDSYVVKHIPFPAKNLEYTVEKIRSVLGVERMLNVKHVSAPDHEQIRFDVPKKSVGVKPKEVSGKGVQVLVGVKNDGENLEVDLSRAPHMLVSGTTGSGKSFAVKGWIKGLLKTPETLVAVIDPKRVDYQEFLGEPKMFGKGIYTETSESIEFLKTLCKMMDNRYEILEKANARDINEYNGIHTIKLQRIVVVIDELADLMLASKKEASQYIERLCQKSRACGIHLILCTQRPSVKVVTGIIKANVPVRISFRVNSRVDSMVILDRMGAENLEGVGRGMDQNGVEFQSVG